MPTDRVMAYLRSVPKPLKKNKKIIENLLTNFQKRAIIKAQRGKAKAEAKRESKGQVRPLRGENPACPQPHGVLLCGI